MELVTQKARDAYLELMADININRKKFESSDEADDTAAEEFLLSKHVFEMRALALQTAHQIDVAERGLQGSCAAMGLMVQEITER